MSPYLYIADNGPSNPVMISGPRSIVFLWDAKLARHIWRPKSLDTFETEAAAIIREETMWKILPGIELTPDPALGLGGTGGPPVVSGGSPETLNLAEVPLDNLRAELARREPPSEKPAAGAPAAPTEPKEASPGQSEVTRAAALGEAGGGKGPSTTTSAPEPRSHKKKK